MDLIEIIALGACVAWVILGEWIFWWVPRSLRRVERTLEQVSPVIVVSGDSYRGLDLAWYRRLQQELEAEGYRFAGDLAEPEVTELTGFRRCMISPDDTVVLFIAHVRFRGSWRLLGPFVGGADRRILGCITELSDGALISTGNLRGSLLDPPPHVDRELHPAETDWRKLLFRHGARVGERLRQRPELTCVSLPDIDAIVGSHERSEEKRVAHHRATGLQKRELQAVSPKWDRPGAVETYAALVERRARERAEREPP